MSAKKMPANALAHTYEIFHRVWFVQLPPGHEFGDLFDPSYWAHHARKLKNCDLVRVRAHDGSFDCHLSIDSVSVGGVVANVWPRYPAGVDAGAALAAVKAAKDARPKYVPILPNGKVSVRIDYHEATKYRLIAIDGSEHSSGYVTEEEAIAARDKYLKELGVALPPQEAIAAAVEKAAKADAERKAAGKARGRAA